MRRLLLPLSFLYWLGVGIRNWFFDKGFLKTTKVMVPVISVGNISAGGVGKTPVVEMLVERLKNKRRLAVVSRGYGRKSTGTLVASDGEGRLATVEETGDEPYQIACKYRDIIVVVDGKRIRAAQKAVELGAEVILLDDGFQHRYLDRNLNIVVLTAREVLDGDFLLPAGNRREPLSSLKRSDAILVSRCADDSEFDRALVKLRPWEKIVAGVRTKARSCKRACSNEPLETGFLSGKHVVAFSGIGAPKSFEDVLTRTGARIAQHCMWPDHHWYTNADIAKIKDAFRDTSASLIVTTEKDLARLRGRFEGFLAEQPVYALEICQELIAKGKEFDELIGRTWS